MKELNLIWLDIATKSQSFSPPSVTLAQIIEETGWGASLLWIRYRNGGGIKYATRPENRIHQTAGFVEMNGEKYAAYREFDDFGRDRRRILLSMGSAHHPASVGEFIESFSHQWCPDSGHDSKAGYGDRLRAIIREYNLTRFDDPREWSAELDTPGSGETRAGTDIPGRVERSAPATDSEPVARASVPVRRGDDSPGRQSDSPGTLPPVINGVTKAGVMETMEAVVMKLVGNPVMIALAKRAWESIQTVEGVKELEKTGVRKLQAALHGVLEHPETVPVLSKLPGFAQRLVRDWILHTIQDYVDAINHSLG